MAGFTINADAAIRLMNELRARQALLVLAVRADTAVAGRRIQATARELAVSRTMPSLAGSIGMRTKQTATGSQVTIEASSPFGYIREFGAGRSGPRPFAGPAAEQHVPWWEQRMSDALARVL